MPGEVTPEDPAYVEEMAAKGAALREGKPAPAAVAPATEPADDRPEWLPEKFKTAADLAAAYAELEKKQGRPAEPAEPTATTETTETTEPAAKTTADDSGLEIPANAEAQLAENGIDLAGLRAEYSANNGLSEDTYGTLEKAGFSRDDVNTYIAGQTALIDQVRTSSFSLVGGEESFSSMQAWASANLSDSEKQAFNSAITVDDATREIAIRGLFAKYTDAVGTDGTQVHSNESGAVSGDIFESRAQLVKAMNNVDYTKDPAYRKGVMDKLARTRKVNSIF